ncbi:MAG TPA: hypothetical protein VMT28_00775 [Terriglobales bacterium]|nr:hypothetical protein [Terriglobales bacterium]
MRPRLPSFVMTMILLSILAPTPIVAQTQPQRSDSVTHETPQDAAEKARILKEMAKKANEKRQADLKRDTEKLLKLATELQQYVDKSNENVLSLEVINKAEEIEKLAHSVKEKMKGN